MATEADGEPAAAPERPAGGAPAGGERRALKPPEASRQARRSFAPRVREDKLSWKDDMRTEICGRQSTEKERMGEEAG